MLFFRFSIKCCKNKRKRKKRVVNKKKLKRFLHLGEIWHASLCPILHLDRCWGVGLLGKRNSVGKCDGRGKRSLFI